MGALHHGHISLVAKAKAVCDYVVVSIFVNPIQFNNAQDLAAYPRLLEADLAAIDSVGIDLVFAPSPEDVYPQPSQLTFNFGMLEQVMEGANRPGHFNGVGVVLSKLFHWVKPSRVFMGLKDLQQVRITQLLVRDLNFDTEIVACDTVREADGLAMSSRNLRLDPQSRALAPKIYGLLLHLVKIAQAGHSKAQIDQAIDDWRASNPAFQLEYVQMVDAWSLQPIEQLHPGQQYAVCFAGWIGGVRLIDNVIFTA